MRQSTSVHWHGFCQARTSYADSPSFINQCPIPPGNVFHYAFDTAGQTGYYGYHSHLSTQYCNGLRGAFVVYDPHDPLRHLYDVDDDSTIITLADWYHDFAPDAQDRFFQTGTVPIPDSGLLNEVPFSVINIVRGLRYRLRVFPISCRPFHTFSVDNHKISAMEFDGVEHDPVTVDNFDIFAARHVSAILHANQPIGNYWILNPNLTLAILRYRGTPNREPTTNNTGAAGVKLNDGDMRPIASEGPGQLGSAPADVAFNLVISQPNLPFFDIDNIFYISPTVPVLLQILSGAAQPQDVLPSKKIFWIPPNATIKISIPGTGAHPFHLHGHNFDVIKVANSNVTNFVNPLGNTTFRFKSDNPGAWFLHCHIDWHLEACLAIVFGETPAENIEGPHKQIPPQDWLDLCPEYDDLDPDQQ
ncbi:hypothetical protein D9758_016762 [Tetrapyrgos nigripes]|uniref:Laccase n=1 Tax=Tetrapyrgos nigripes TaxID=182062 RepID=A0A8H5CDS8_9AGAR|nr:hypothetical protein D9758_016762 [Tetrapyrgos nigripes]